MIHVFTILVQILILKNFLNWFKLDCEWLINTNNSLLVNFTYLSVPVPGSVQLYSSIDNDASSIVDDSNPAVTDTLDFIGVPIMKIVFVSQGIPLGLVRVLALTLQNN